jgi:hypothetical protein
MIEYLAKKLSTSCFWAKNFYRKNRDKKLMSVRDCLRYRKDFRLDGINYCITKRGKLLYNAKNGFHQNRGITWYMANQDKMAEVRKYE